MDASGAGASRQKLYTLLGFAAFIGCTVLAITGLPDRPWPGALRDPAVRSLALDCGREDDPTGTGMPAWPTPDAPRYYTRQRWTDQGDLKVEVWEFLAPGHVLVSAARQVQGQRIVIRPRWEVPPNGSIAACHAKLGVEVTFQGLPRGAYAVEAK